MGKCNPLKDENEKIFGFVCQIDYEEDLNEDKEILEMIDKREKNDEGKRFKYDDYKEKRNYKLKSLNPEILLKEFCTGECIVFGTESQGIMTISKIYENEEDFLKDYIELIDDSFENDIDNVVYFSIYFNLSFINEEGDGYFYWPFSKELPEGSIEIGKFFGVEYDC